MELPKVIGPLIFLAIGALIFSIGAYFTYNDYVAANNWQSVNAVVTSSSLQRNYGDEGGITYGPNIEYSYDVNGKSYTGYCCQYTTFDLEGVQKMLDRNSVDSDIAVLVNPNDEYQSKMKEDADPFKLFNMIFVSFGVIFTIVGAIITYKTITEQQN